MALGSSLIFTFKSLMADLVGPMDLILSDLYSIITKDSYHKRINFFSLGA